MIGDDCASASFECVGGFDGACSDVVNIYHEFAILHQSFDNCRIALLRLNIRTTAHYLRPFARAVGGIEAIFVGVSADDDTASCLLQQRSPKIGASALPNGIIVSVSRVGIGWCYVAGIVFWVAVEERDMAKRYDMRSRSYLFLLESVSEPFGLSFAISMAIEKSGKQRVGVEFVFASVETNKSDIAHTHGKVAAQVPVAAQAFFGLAIHPHIFKISVSHTTQVVVAGAVEVGDVGGISVLRNFGLDEDAFLRFDGFLGVAGVAVPYYTRRRELSYLFR